MGQFHLQVLMCYRAAKHQGQRSQGCQDLTIHQISWLFLFQSLPAQPPSIRVRGARAATIWLYIKSADCSFFRAYLRSRQAAGSEEPGLPGLYIKSADCSFFRAYLRSRQAAGSEEPRLPGFDYTSNQLFVPFSEPTCAAAKQQGQRSLGCQGLIIHQISWLFLFQSLSAQPPSSRVRGARAARVWLYIKSADCSFFRAYLRSRQAAGSEEPRLPGFDYTSNQLIVPFSEPTCAAAKQQGQRSQGCQDLTIRLVSCFGSQRLLWGKCLE